MSRKGAPHLTTVLAGCMFWPVDSQRPKAGIKGHVAQVYF